MWWRQTISITCQFMFTDYMTSTAEVAQKHTPMHLNVSNPYNLKHDQYLVPSQKELNSPLRHKHSTDFLVIKGATCGGTWCDVIVGFSGCSRECVQECGELRGEGWVQQESGGDMVGGRERKVPSGKGSHTGLCPSHTHSTIWQGGKKTPNSFQAGDDKSICQEPKDFCDRHPDWIPRAQCIICHY